MQVSGCFLLMNLDPDVYDSEKMLSKLTGKISGVKGVTEVHTVQFGPYDMIVKIEGSDEGKLKSAGYEVRKISGVKSALINLILGSYNP